MKTVKSTSLEAIIALIMEASRSATRRTAGEQLVQMAGVLSMEGGTRRAKSPIVTKMLLRMASAQVTAVAINVLSLIVKKLLYLEESADSMEVVSGAAFLTAKNGHYKEASVKIMEVAEGAK